MEKEQFTKYPLFGKANIVKSDVMNEWCYNNGKSHYSPVIGNADITATLVIGNNTKVHTFSNGSEAEGWFCQNCYQCKKRNDTNADPDDIRKDGGCPLELRLALAYMDDGTVPMKTVKRIGYNYLGVQRHGVFAHLTHCKEYEEAPKEETVKSV